jgi:RNA polymerase sigma-70 factor (ECF subfamily)
LLARAGAGDEAAITVLYRDLAPAVIGYLRGAGSNDPEDLAGDVFVAMVRLLPDFSGDVAAFRRWVFSIAHHRLVDERRRLARRRRIDDVISLEDEHYADASDSIVSRLDAGGVVVALDALTDDQRSVVLLRTVAELSVADTAEVLGKREGAVKTLHRRALATMRRTLGEAS